MLGNIYKGECIGLDIKMKEYICMEEGISVNISETEDICPYCNGEVIDIDVMEIRDWMEVIENNIEGLETNDYLKIIEEIKKLRVVKKKTKVKKAKVKK